MTDHSTAIVPLEAWTYASPSLKHEGIQVNIGLMAEALIYYDKILINVTNQPQFADVLDWFIRQGAIDHLTGLLEDGVLGIYDYSFLTVAIDNAGTYSIWNIQDPIQEKPNTFEPRYLGHPDVRRVLPTSRKRKRLIRAIRNSVTEVKAADFGPAIENSKVDFDDPRRNALLVQSFVNELYRFRCLGRPPIIETSIEQLPESGQRRITYNIDFNELNRQAGQQINFHRGSPLTANAISNRFLYSASKLKCDLYMPTPMSDLVGDKLYEVASRVLGASMIIDQLQASVEFPDISSLVNTGKLNLSDILELRDRASKFREWLQSEAERDRDAIIAYHSEVAKDSGFSKSRKIAFSLFGVLAGGAVGAYIGSEVGGMIGGIVGASVKYLFGLGADLASEWKPIVFGDWMKSRIDRLMSEYESF